MDDDSSGIEKRTKTEATRRAAADVLFHSIEQELFQKNAIILDDMTYAFDLSEQELREEHPPKQWARDMGVREARRRFRIAKYALLPAKDAPIAISQASKVVTNMMKAKGAAVGSTNRLPVNVIEVQEPSITRTVEDEPYEVVDVDPEDDL